ADGEALAVEAEVLVDPAQLESPGPRHAPEPRRLRRAIPHRRRRHFSGGVHRRARRRTTLPPRRDVQRLGPAHAPSFAPAAGAEVAPCGAGSFCRIDVSINPPTSVLSLAN